MRVRLPQNAAFSGITASRHIAPNKFSKPKISIPTEKPQVARERFLRHAAMTASVKLKAPAMKARIAFGLTNYFYPTSCIALQTQRPPELSAGKKVAIVISPIQEKKPPPAT
jgi:hypothetical protein